jgi:putative transposase
MQKSPRVHSPAFKAQVALAALKGDQTLSQVAAQSGVHVKLVQAWKKQMIEEASTVFAGPAQASELKQAEAQQAELYEQIGRLKMELEWLKKKLPSSGEGKRQQIEPEHEWLSVRRQCQLLGLSRSSLSYEAVGGSSANLARMARLDRLPLEYPFFGARKLAVMLSTPEEEVNRKRVQRLMRLMGLECLFCRPKTTVSGAGHRKYPYLLRGFKIDRPQQVWSADMTDVPMPIGFMYLAATIDWYSRSVVSWRLSNTLEGSFCQAMLEDALRQGTPTIVNTDQGSQFTATAWTSRLETARVQVSMEGRGRCHDNIFVERLWRSVK